MSLALCPEPEYSPNLAALYRHDVHTVHPSLGDPAPGLQLALLVVSVDVDPKDPSTLAGQGRSRPPLGSLTLHLTQDKAFPLRSCVWRGLLPSSRRRVACGLPRPPAKGRLFGQQRSRRAPGGQILRLKGRRTGYRHQNLSSKPCASSCLSSWGHHAVPTLTWQRRNHPLLFLLPPPGPPAAFSTQAFVQTGKAPLPATFHFHLSEGCHNVLVSLEQDSSLPSAKEMSETQATDSAKSVTGKVPLRAALPLPSRSAPSLPFNSRIVHGSPRAAELSPRGPVVLPVPSRWPGVGT